MPRRCRERDWHTPSNHAEFLHTHHCSQRSTDRLVKMTNPQHEEGVLCSPSCRWVSPSSRAMSHAVFLASVGELGVPESRLGPTRKDALRILSTRLDRFELWLIQQIWADWDVSGPHPVHTFGPGWTDEDERRLKASAVEYAHERGIEDEATWLASRHSHWYFRLIDRLPSWRWVVYQLSILRRLRWIRYA
jgi:hypothetical protein